MQGGRSIWEGYMSRWLVLDLDGTLVDSVPDIAAALNRLMRSRNLNGFDEPEVMAMVGDGARPLVERGFAARGADMDAMAVPDFLADYTAHAAVASRAYPCVADTLARLRDDGWTMAVCTNKPEIPARLLLTALGLDGFFAAVGGGDSFSVRKPDPGHLLATLAVCGGDPARTIMVGDHHNDVHAATHAGIRSIWARWGYGADVEGATESAAAFRDLPEVLGRLLAV
jgi:phosphoglycolate phosphatase